MRQRSVTARLLAAVVVAALPAPSLPAVPEPGSAELGGVILTAEQTHLAGARLLAADPAQGKVYRSEPTAPNGSFALSGLEPGTYDLAVEVDGGLYLVEDPLYLVAGVKRTVRIAVGAEPPPEPGVPSPRDATTEQAPSLWNNPVSAGAIVLGIAIVVGVLVANATEDDEVTSTQVNPN
jgi:hypothetical protein